MLFMCKIDVSIPPEMAQADKDELRKRETVRAEALIGAGTLVRIWRIVGRVANFSVWSTPTLEALHDALGSLPMFPYMKIEVTPLIDHPVTQIAEARNTRKP